MGMKRWNFIAMMDAGRKLFASIHRKKYLATWWVKSSQRWQYEEIMRWFIQACWDSAAKDIAATILRSSVTCSIHEILPVGLNPHATA